MDTSLYVHIHFLYSACAESMCITWIVGWWHMAKKELKMLNQVVYAFLCWIQVYILYNVIMHLHIFNDMHAELVHDCNYNSHSVIESDIQKAFDSVPHKALIDKLESIGLNCFLLRWICSYLLNRKQFVVLNGAKSTTVGIWSSPGFCIGASLVP